MKAKKESTKLAEKAIRRAAQGVLSDAVKNNESIPLWDGHAVVWKVPHKEMKQITNQADV